MGIRNVRYFFSEALLSIRRNKLMSFATLLTIAVSLFIVGLFALLVLNANHVLRDLQESVEIAVFLEVETPRDETEALGEAIAAIPGVADLDLVTKEEGLEMLSRQFGSGHDLLASLGGENPLPDFYRVRVEGPEYLEYAAQAILGMPYVEKTDYGKAVMERVFQLVRYIRWIGFVTIGVLCFLAMFLIFITIKLTVFSRQKEIKVMKYVGSSDSFIRAPFVIKGTILGVVGALCADLALLLSYYFLARHMSRAITFLTPVMDPVTIAQVLVGLLGVGALIGLFGSNLSISKYLRV